MQKPEFEVMYFDKDIINTSNCPRVCTGVCGSYTCNAECASNNPSACSVDDL